MTSWLKRMIGVSALLGSLLAGSAASASGQPHVPAPDACLRSMAHSVDAAWSPGGVPRASRARLARGSAVTDLFGPQGDARVGETFHRLRRLGFGHVRIPIAPEVFASPPPPWQADALIRLDRAVCAAVAADLGIIIDLHPVTALAPAGGSPDAVTTRLASVWRALAGRYRGTPSDAVFFEVLNEPKIADVTQWEAMQERLIHVIRGVAPRQTIIATSSPWSTAAALAALTPSTDPNVAYAFHFYTPMIFTHQAAAWSIPSYGSIRGLDFPARPANVDAVSQGADAALLPELGSYRQTFGSPEPLIRELDLAAAWGRDHGAVVVATEFGVFAEAAPPAARARWLRVVRETLEHDAIGWTVWEFRGGFGIASDADQGCHAPTSAMAALGLCGNAGL